MKYSNIYNQFVSHLSNCLDAFNWPLVDVNFLLETFEEVTLQEGYVLDVYKVMDTYYRDGEYFLQLYTCKDRSEIEYIPKLVNVRDTLLKKLRLQKSEKKYVPDFDSSMYIAHPIPIALMDSIPCDNLIVPFTESGIWEALMLKIAYMHLPKFGHGCYKKSRLIIDKDALENVIEQYKLAKIDNSVSIQGNKAVVRYTYWNEWEGIVKVTLQAYKVGESIKWDASPKKEVIDSQTSTTRF